MEDELEELERRFRDMKKKIIKGKVVNHMVKKDVANKIIKAKIVKNMMKDGEEFLI